RRTGPHRPRLGPRRSARTLTTCARALAERCDAQGMGARILALRTAHRTDDRPHVDRLSKATENEMPERVASCSCGQLKVTVSAEPIRVSVCHCLACQRRTGSVFGAQARVTRAAASVSGTSSVFVRGGDEGGRAASHFCPTCGATASYTHDGQADTIARPGASFRT